MYCRWRMPTNKRNDGQYKRTNVSLVVCLCSTCFCLLLGSTLHHALPQIPFILVTTILLISYASSQDSIQQLSRVESCAVQVLFTVPSSLATSNDTEDDASKSSPLKPKKKNIVATTPIDSSVLPTVIKERVGWQTIQQTVPDCGIAPFSVSLLLFPPRHVHAISTWQVMSNSKSAQSSPPSQCSMSSFSLCSRRV